MRNNARGQLLKGISAPKWYERVRNLGSQFYLSEFTIAHCLIQDRLLQIREKKSHFFLLSKRIFDVLFSATALLFLSPLFLFVALLIKFTSGGEIFFKHKRVGLNGTIFYTLKFRTMNHNAENVLLIPAMYAKNASDNRVTPLGKFLRNYKIDEFPQLWNVLKGEMSIVGPRPVSIEDASTMRLINWDRLALRPGVTGLWQANISSKSTPLRKLRLDRAYVRRASWLLDLNLILKSFKIVFLGENKINRKKATDPKTTS